MRRVASILQNDEKDRFSRKNSILPTYYGGILPPLPVHNNCHGISSHKRPDLPLNIVLNEGELGLSMKELHVDSNTRCSELCILLGFRLTYQVYALSVNI